MANTILTPTAVTRKAVAILHNQLGFTKHVNRQYDDSFAKSGAKIGDSLKIRMPNEFTIRSGATIDVQDLNESSVTLQVATQRGVDINFSSAELTLSLDDFSERILEPAMARLASEIDRLGLMETLNIYNAVGVSGTTPADAITILKAGQKLDENAVPRDGNRHLILNPEAQATIVDALKALFQSSPKLKAQYEKGEMGEALGFNWWMDQNVYSLTTGTRVGTIIMDGTSVEASKTIHVDAITSGTYTLKAGEIFTVANCYSVNPETKQTNGSLQQWVATADATTASTDGEFDILVEPQICTSASGVLQTVNSLPADGKTVIFMGKGTGAAADTAATVYPQNLAFHRDAFTLACADLVMPKGVDFAAREVYDGISLRIVRQYDINNDTFPCRIDVLFGWKTVRPRMACRIFG